MTSDTFWRRDRTTRDLQYERNVHRHIETFMKGIVAHPLGTCRMRDAYVLAAWACAP